MVRCVFTNIETHIEYKAFCVIESVLFVDFLYGNVYWLSVYLMGCKGMYWMEGNYDIFKEMLRLFFF